MLSRKKYILLEKRTKTIADLRREDSSDIRKKANSDIEPFKKKVNQNRAGKLKAENFNNN